MSPLLHCLPLVVNVERERACNALALLQKRAAGYDETEAGHALDALVGRTDKEVYAESCHVDGHSAEAAHRVDNQRLAVALHYGGYFFKRIEHAGGRLAVDYRHMGHFLVLGQVSVDGRRADGFSLVELHHVAVQPVILGNHAHAFAVSAVGCDEQMVVRTHRAAERSLDTERAAALHQHRRIFFGAARSDAYKLFPDYFHYAFVIVFVPCAPVAHHGVLHCLRCSQRSGGKQ